MTGPQITLAILQTRYGKQQEFTAKEAKEATSETLQNLYRDNNTIEASIRSYLQILCADGYITRVRRGLYSWV
jgi:hypothetical protein